ncbi:serine/threonine protein kinase [Aquicella siphonis]|uniref:serine/threonine protein kinase n=1 Tax=Aquicella siphonis TaxID=254247 RepID=UPI0011DD3097|nr:serine/threonine protein kinase [Aquicella siphonis]
MNNTNTPYTNLDPSLIMDAIESLDYRCSGSLFALNSYENRVYQVGIEDRAPLIVKFYRPFRWSDAAIIEEHQFAIELAACDIPVVAPLECGTGETLHRYQGFRFALFPRQSGRSLELDNLEHLEWMGRFIGRLHAVGACRPFQHRMELNVETYGHAPYRFLVDNQFIPFELRHNFCLVLDQLLAKTAQCFDEAGCFSTLRLHGDCHAGNVLWNDKGPHIVDLDDCLTGPAIQDIWMLLSGSAEQVEVQLDRILDGYCEFYDYNPRELHLIEPLRTLRMIHYVGWLAKRWEDPAFPLNFPWFNTPRYWQDFLQNLNEQNALLDLSLDKMRHPEQ